VRDAPYFVAGALGTNARLRGYEYFPGFAYWVPHARRSGMKAIARFRTRRRAVPSFIYPMLRAGNT